MKHNSHYFKKPEYCGRILTEKYSKALKKRVSECIAAFRAFEEIGDLSIPYISAWHEDKNVIWYEFAARGFTDLMGCDISSLAGVFRNSILDRRIYRYPEGETGIQKEVLSREGLEGARKQLRENGKEHGIVEAVYKISLGENIHCWLKDSAVVETYKKDNVCLSIGCLTVVSKEMESEEKCENLIVELKNALAKVKTLSGLLPVCSHCKKIRDDKGYWNQLETYILEHSDAEVSNSICEECAKEHFRTPHPDLGKPWNVITRKPDK
ncbi:MAG: hypothetical protein KKH97_04280 [Proteobacteria bacterium]|nr:hypothetical protein [Pseudomonadota bacterium]MBU1713855.1 hypothetical protein [Pseudomonadota bacterium]